MLLMVLTASLITSITTTGCSKGSAATARSTPAFDQKWTTLAQKGTEAIYIEDNGGEGLMGNVLRTQTSTQSAAPIKAENKDAPLPAAPDPDRVQQIVRQYLPGVKSCYLRMSRAGSPPSGKAIVSFGIAGSGQVQELKVDAPAFEGTQLTPCISGQVAHWVFPASRDGMDGMSYPFVFVGT
jgi:hypothetical protein